jgi:hypothetical protein
MPEMKEKFARIEFHIEGLNQQVWHNAQLADPNCDYTTRIKKITAKGKKKTETDIAELEDLEWEGGLYLDHERRVIVPGTVIEGAYFEAGKKTRDGQDVRNGICSNGDWRLSYDGPKDLAALKADPRFRLRCIVRNPATKGRLARVRPIFRQWALAYVIDYYTKIFNKQQIVDMTELLGEEIGLSDDRKKMGGRFRVVKVKG